MAGEIPAVGEESVEEKDGFFEDVVGGGEDGEGYFVEAVGLGFGEFGLELGKEGFVFVYLVFVVILVVIVGSSGSSSIAILLRGVIGITRQRLQLLGPLRIDISDSLAQLARKFCFVVRCPLAKVEVGFECKDEEREGNGGEDGVVS